MATVKEITAHLLKYDQNAHVAVAIWQVCDVTARAKERGIEITVEQAESIIDRMHRRHDASLGISWDTIDAYLDDL